MDEEHRIAELLETPNYGVIDELVEYLRRRRPDNPQEQVDLLVRGMSVDPEHSRYAQLSDGDRFLTPWDNIDVVVCSICGWTPLRMAWDQDTVDCYLECTAWNGPDAPNGLRYIRMFAETGGAPQLADWLRRRKFPITIDDSTELVSDAAQATRGRVEWGPDFHAEFARWRGMLERGEWEAARDAPPPTSVEGFIGAFAAYGDNGDPDGMTRTSLVARR